MNIPIFFNDKSLPASSYEEGCFLLFNMAKELATLLDLLSQMDAESEMPSTDYVRPDEGDGETEVGESDDEDEEDEDTSQPSGCEWISESNFEYHMLTDNDIINKVLEDEDHQYGDFRDEFLFLSSIHNISPILENIQERWSSVLKEADVYYEGDKQENWVAAAAAAVEEGVLASLNTGSPWDREQVPLEIFWLDGDKLPDPIKIHALNLSSDGHADVVFRIVSDKIRNLSLANWGNILPGVRIDSHVLRWLKDISVENPKLLRRILGHMSRAHRLRYKVDGKLVKSIVSNDNLPILEIRIRHFKSAIRMFLVIEPDKKCPIYLFGGIKAQKQTGWYNRAKLTCRRRFQAFLGNSSLGIIP